MLIMQRKTHSGYACLIELDTDQRLETEQWAVANIAANTVPFKNPHILAYQHMDSNEQYEFMHSSAFFYQIDFGSQRRLRQFALWAIFTNIVIVSATHKV